MKTLSHKIVVLMMIVFASCSTDEAVSPKNSDLIKQLDETRWALATCAEHPYIIINGFNECEYLDYLNFSGSKVHIKPKGAPYIATHHICYIYDNKLVVSIQECSNSTWRSLFEWTVISINGNTLTVDVTSPDLAPEYKERFEYNRL